MSVKSEPPPGLDLKNERYYRPETFKMLFRLELRTREGFLYVRQARTH